MLGGIAHACWTLEAHLRSHLDTLQSRVRELEGAIVTRDGYMQE